MNIPLLLCILTSVAAPAAFEWTLPKQSSTSVLNLPLAPSFLESQRRRYYCFWPIEYVQYYWNNVNCYGKRYGSYNSIRQPYYQASSKLKIVATNAPLYAAAQDSVLNDLNSQQNTYYGGEMTASSVMRNKAGIFRQALSEKTASSKIRDYLSNILTPQGISQRQLIDSNFGNNVYQFQVNANQKVFDVQELVNSAQNRTAGMAAAIVNKAFWRANQFLNWANWNLSGFYNNDTLAVLRLNQTEKDLRNIDKSRADSDLSSLRSQLAALVPTASLVSLIGNISSYISSIDSRSYDMISQLWQNGNISNSVTISSMENQYLPTYQALVLNKITALNSSLDLPTLARKIAVDMGVADANRSVQIEDLLAMEKATLPWVFDLIASDNNLTSGIAENISNSFNAESFANGALAGTVESLAQLIAKAKQETLGILQSGGSTTGSEFFNAIMQRVVDVTTTRDALLEEVKEQAKQMVALIAQLAASVGMDFDEFVALLGQAKSALEQMQKSLSDDASGASGKKMSSIALQIQTDMSAQAAEMVKTAIKTGSSTSDLVNSVVNANLQAEALAQAAAQDTMNSANGQSVAAATAGSAVRSLMSTKVSGSVDAAAQVGALFQGSNDAIAGISNALEQGTMSANGKLSISADAVAAALQKVLDGLAQYLGQQTEHIADGPRLALQKGLSSLENSGESAKGKIAAVKDALDLSMSNLGKKSQLQNWARLADASNAVSKAASESPEIFNSVHSQFSHDLGMKSAAKGASFGGIVSTAQQGANAATTRLNNLRSLFFKAVETLITPSLSRGSSDQAKYSAQFADAFADLSLKTNRMNDLAPGSAVTNRNGDAAGGAASFSFNELPGQLDALSAFLTKAPLDFQEKSKQLLKTLMAAMANVTWVNEHQGREISNSFASVNATVDPILQGMQRELNNTRAALEGAALAPQPAPLYETGEALGLLSALLGDSGEAEQAVYELLAEQSKISLKDSQSNVLGPLAVIIREIGKAYSVVRNQSSEAEETVAASSAAASALLSDSWKTTKLATTTTASLLGRAKSEGDLATQGGSSQASDDVDLAESVAMAAGAAVGGIRAAASNAKSDADASSRSAALAVEASKAATTSLLGKAAALLASKTAGAAPNSPAGLQAAALSALFRQLSMKWQAFDTAMGSKLTELAPRVGETIDTVNLNIGADTMRNSAAIRDALDSVILSLNLALTASAKTEAISNFTLNANVTLGSTSAGARKFATDTVEATRTALDQIVAARRKIADDELGTIKNSLDGLESDADSKLSR